MRNERFPLKKHQNSHTFQMPARQGKVFCFHYSIQCCRTPMPSCEFLWPHNGWI